MKPFQRVAGFGLKPLPEERQNLSPAFNRSWLLTRTLGTERIRFLAVVPDPSNRFPCSRQGQVGLEEGWNLARQIRDVIDEDSIDEKRAIVAIVDVPSQAYGRREELLGIFLAAAPDRCVRLRKARRAPGGLPRCRPRNFRGFFDAWRAGEPIAGLA